MRSPYEIYTIEPEWVLEPEAMGSKIKFWCRLQGNKPDWLFKYPQPRTGQHWAEKIAEQIAKQMDILHARVELAIFQEERGSITESFVEDWDNLSHGNQILAGFISGYDLKQKFKHSNHTLNNIFHSLENIFTIEDAQMDAKKAIADYLVLDAVIGNTDRHHENWGILLKRESDHWIGKIAPSFDHASSLGRELLDEGSKRSRESILGNISNYAEKARGAVYWESSDKHALSPLELIRKASGKYPDIFRQAIERVRKLDSPVMNEIVASMPDGWMSKLEKAFAVELVCYNIIEIQRMEI